MASKVEERLREGRERLQKEQRQAEEALQALRSRGDPRTAATPSASRLSVARERPWTEIEKWKPLPEVA